MKGLNELAQEIYKGNKSRGFHDKPQETGTYLMLMVSELGECLEADRKGKQTMVNISMVSEIQNQDTFLFAFKEDVKDTVEDELADALIRILDYCGLKGIDIQSHMEAKLRYNSSRPHKHGKAY